MEAVGIGAGALDLLALPLQLLRDRVGGQHHLEGGGLPRRHLLLNHEDVNVGGHGQPLVRQVKQQRCLALPVRAHQP